MSPAEPETVSLADGAGGTAVGGINHRSGQENAPPFHVGFHHLADDRGSGAWVSFRVYTGHSVLRLKQGRR